MSDAARQEAARLYLLDGGDPATIISLRETFLLGSDWQAASRVEVTDAMVERAAEMAETIHRYRSAPMHMDIDAIERRYCECGDAFFTTDAHRKHVYRKMVEAALNGSDDD